MKIFRLAALAALLLPVGAAAQATKTIPLGGGFALDTKIPVTFNPAEFNKKFAAQMDAFRALEASQKAALSRPAVPQAKQAAAVENDADYTRCIVCREKILKSDGYRVTPKRDWYVKKSSPCACEFYKGWLSGEDLSFLQTAEKRHSCEETMSDKYQTHTCAVCGKPINAACGAISTWEDSKGKHYAHADCFDGSRHQAAKETLLKNLAITEEDCARFDRQKKQQQEAQQQLAEELKASAQQRLTQQAAAEEEEDLPVTVKPAPRSFEEVNKDYQRFMARHGQALQNVARIQREGGTLSKRQQTLLNRFNTLRDEYNQAQGTGN